MSTSASSKWHYLKGRLQDAVEGLGLLQQSTDDIGEKNRLEAKASGVQLALSYMDEFDRGLS